MRASFAKIMSGLTVSCSLCVANVTAQAEDTVTEHADVGLPQLDISTFPNQLFWLVVMGVILYVLMSKVALPRVQNIMHQRDAFVHDHLRRAAALRKKSEDAKVDYDLTIRDAETNAKNVLNKTVTDMKQKHDAAAQDVLKQVMARAQTAEERLQAEKQKIMATVDDNAARLADDILLTVFDMKPAAR